MFLENGVTASQVNRMERGLNRIQQFQAQLEKVSHGLSNNVSQDRWNSSPQDTPVSGSCTLLGGLSLPIHSIACAGRSAWDTLTGNRGTKPAFRVGQLDAELLDEELLSVLKNYVVDGLKYLRPNFALDFSAEIDVALRALLFKVCFWDRNTSYGAYLQGLQYVNAAGSWGDSHQRVFAAPTRLQKTIYGIFNVFGAYAWQKWEEYLLKREADSDEIDSEVYTKLLRWNIVIETIYSVISTVSFLAFLVNGRYRTILDRVARVRLVPTFSTYSRQVSVEFLNRQLVWHSFTEFLLFVLPLIGVNRWRIGLRRSWGLILRAARRLRLSSRLTDSQNQCDTKKGKGRLYALPERICGICYIEQTSGTSFMGGSSDYYDATVSMDLDTAGMGGIVGSMQRDITNPYTAMPCGCVYCYICLARKLENEDGNEWACLRCGERVTGLRPWNGDLLEDKLQANYMSDISTDEKDHDDSGVPLMQVNPQPISDELEDHGTRSGRGSLAGHERIGGGGGMFTEAFDTREFRGWTSSSDEDTSVKADCSDSDELDGVYS